MKGVSAVIAAILMLMITMALAGVAYFYISGIFAAKTALIEPVGDASVTAGAGPSTCSISWRIRNTAATGVTVTVQNVSLIGCTSFTGFSALDTSFSMVGGETKTIGAIGCKNVQTHIAKAVGPSNTVNLIAFCP